MIFGARKTKDESNKLFRLVHVDHSGINFINELEESDTLNALTFEYLYNGGGVGAADFNNDGLSDVFFAGNLTSSRLYINLGNMVFQDVTSAAGVTTNTWCTGVSVVDINRDGLLDIYISTIHPGMSKTSPNIFFINQGPDENGVPKFKDLASEMGVADPSYSTQAAFLDYDRDGDLDMYLLTNALENYTRNAPIGQHYDGKGKSVDKLFRQDTLANGDLHFTDVSAQAGIQAEGWGLGIVLNDFNNDGWPDVYCANDFLSSDHLYINQQDGTFRDQIGEYMSHQEFNGMGVDMADLNEDGYNELVAIDMMPDDNARQKAMFSGTGYDRFMKSIAMNYQPQYVRNVLQRNNGNNTFSDIGYQSGIYATDWSWSVLLADFDNDGLRDIFITNGYPKDVTDMDFVAYSKDASRFGNAELKQQSAAKAIKELKGVHKPNLAFRNRGNFAFDDATDEWGFSTPCYSNGAAYADFDNDGDLDLVINNLKEIAHLYENTTNPSSKKDANFLRIKFHGPPSNSQGIGAKIRVYMNNEIKCAEQQLQRGYLSSIDPVVHFGLGAAQHVDSLLVVWPDGKSQVLKDLSINTTISAAYSNARPIKTMPSNEPMTLLTEDKLIPVIQKETPYVDYKFGQPTLPHKFSQMGPGIAVGDVNGDKLEDFIIGGPARQSAKLFLQKKDHSFTVDSLETKISEDTGLLLVDVDDDSDLDLYCVSGSTEFGRDTVHYRDRLYKNDGKGNFKLDVDALPSTTASGSCVVANDYDKDGDLDLFVGGRIVPMSYPLPGESYLLQNDGKGKFTNVTRTDADSLHHTGMVSSALFTDFDNDSWTDLIVVGEWMPITIFRNVDGRFRKYMQLERGWWNSITGGDFDNDGDTDYIAGNLGTNSVLRASDAEPVRIYYKDFDKNGSIDPFISRYIQGKEHPVHYRETMTDQVSMLRRTLKRYADYGKMEMKDIIDFLGNDNVKMMSANWFESAYIENTGNGNFRLIALPSEIQVSPLYGIVACDLNDDAFLDFVAVGNSFAEETLSGWYDAGIGVCALGKGDGSFKIMKPLESGFCVRSDTKGLARIRVDGKSKLIVTSNNAPLRMFMINGQNEKSRAGRKSEVYLGSGYLSP
jgi:enediyne biosynthesis protein E4